MKAINKLSIFDMSAARAVLYIVISFCYLAIELTYVHRKRMAPANGFWLSLKKILGNRLIKFLCCL